MLLKICDEKGSELPLGEQGEIVIQGENVMLLFLQVGLGKMMKR
jgi:hypothetical protein